MTPVSTASYDAPADASTYDDYASCADRSDDASALALPPDTVDADNDCRVRPHIAIAALDCNDARLSTMVGAMIGTCDMPQVRARSRVPTLHSPTGKPSGRAPDLFGAANGHPLHAPSRSRADAEPTMPALAVAALVPPQPQDGRCLSPLLLPTQSAGSRLERPPRA